MMNIFYAGIGGRNTPSDVLIKIEDIAEFLGKKNFILRSGGANGADSAFEIGNDKVNGSKEIYLPWKNFNNNPSELYLQWNIDKEFYDIIREINPAIFTQGHSSLVLHARDCQQVLGRDLKTPSSFILCWTDRDISWPGGTAFAINLALKRGIPVVNMIEKDWEVKLEKILRLF